MTSTNTTSTMKNTLELFADKNTMGKSVLLTGNTPNLANESFTDETKSLRAIGDPWVVFDKNIYGGDFHFYEGAHMEMPPYQNQINSTKILSGGLKDPQLIIYEGHDCTGKNITLYEEQQHFDIDGFNGKAASAKCIKGSWIIYQERNLGGQKRIIIAGEKTPENDDHDKGWRGIYLSATPVTESDLENK